MIPDADASVGYVANARTDTPECRATFDDFDDSLAQARRCARDEDCTIAIGTCTSARTDSKALLQHKLEAVGSCVDIIALTICLEARPICFEKLCRARGRVDTGTGDHAPSK